MRHDRKEAVRQPYGRYHQQRLPAKDAELTHVGPDTPAGEYLRRFWQPVARFSATSAAPSPALPQARTTGLGRDRLARVARNITALSHSPAATAAE
jgi:hypothetical protein